MAVKLPDAPPTDKTAIVIAGVGLAANMTNLSADAKDNITQLAVWAIGFLVAGDTARRLGRQKWLNSLLKDRDADGIPDWLERTPLAWWIAFTCLFVAAGLAAALLVVVLT